MLVLEGNPYLNENNIESEYPFVVSSHRKVILCFAAMS